MKVKANYKIPFIFRAIRWAFPKVEKLSPWLAGKWAAKLFFTPVRFPVPLEEAIIQEKAEKFSLTVEGKRVACYSYGKGKPVIMVHGWSGRGAQFRKFIERFVDQGLQVITFDAPAHGNSSGSITSVIEFADVIRQLDDRYKPNLIIGHSLGGVACLLAAQNGLLHAHQIVMISSPSIAEDVVKEFLKKINGTRKSARGITDHIYRKSGKSFVEFLSLHLIRQISNMDIKIIHDEEDREVPLYHAEALVEAYPLAKLVKTRGLGHTRILKDSKVVEECFQYALSGNRLQEV
ncbi:MAG: alpha/beta hydrolase [Cyclobacteriaceae bacterium]|nr:alpha/beta hydrolase [Cyclobacteriaceae bacterium]